ncbi:hypothetical protein [Okeania sp. SIO1F9]|nr:hypothetical protein [Okeania sp. SIO1F9]
MLNFIMFGRSLDLSQESGVRSQESGGKKKKFFTEKLGLKPRR